MKRSTKQTLSFWALMATYVILILFGLSFAILKWTALWKFVTSW